MPPLSFVIVCCLLTGSLCESKRVIFMPFLSPSQAHKHVDLARAVMEKGHEVWLILPDTGLAYGGANTTGMSIIQYHTTFSLEDGVLHPLILSSFFSGDLVNWEGAHDRTKPILHEIMTNQSLYEEMKSVQADLFVFDDLLFMAKMFVVFPYRLGIPFVGVDYTFQPFYHTIPFSPATVPAFLTGFSQHMTLVQRMQNAWAFFSQFMFNPYDYEDAVARYAPEMDYVPVSMLLSRAELWLVGSDPILQDPHPTLPNVKYVGGLSAKPAEPLDPEFQSFMDSGKDGVIVVSFGSLVANLSQEITEKLMTAFLQLRPMKVVFRINVTSPDTESILTSLWLPQNSVLGHRNCQVFVTHCGLNGQYQGLYHAVPMLGLPMFYDQFEVANNMVLKGFGINMDIRKVCSRLFPSLFHCSRRFTRGDGRGATPLYIFLLF